MRYLILILIFSACTKGKENYFNTFPQAFQLKGEISHDVLYKMGNLSIHDSLLVVAGLNLSRGDKMVQLYNLNSMKLYNSYIEIGDGPTELPVPIGIRLGFGNLYVHELSRSSIYEYNLQDLSIHDDDASFIQHTLDPEIFFLDFEPEQQHLISFARRDNHDTLISFINYDGTIDITSHINNSIRAYSEEIDQITVQSNGLFSYCKHPDLEHYAFAFRYADKVAVVDKTGNVLHAMIGPLKLKQTPGVNQTLIEAYRQIRCDENFIYCAYKGNILEANPNYNFPVLATTIYVFNWNCQPVAKLILDYDIMDFDIDHKHQRIVTWSNMTGSLVMYELPNL
jgi:hypothetical protein